MRSRVREVSRFRRAIRHGGMKLPHVCAAANAWTETELLRVTSALAANWTGYLRMSERWDGVREATDTTVQIRYYEALAANAMIIGAWILIGLESCLSAALTVVLTMLPRW